MSRPRRFDLGNAGFSSRESGQLFRRIRLSPRELGICGRAQGRSGSLLYVGPRVACSNA